jgi:type IV secretory pathway VirD2 relaxase
MGLGSLNTIGLSQAREEAGRWRGVLKEGRDPIDVRDAARAAQQQQAARPVAVTFERCSNLYMAAHESGWRNAKHRQQWNNTLATYAYPTIGALPGEGDPQARRLAVGRLQKLERMGLATAAGPGQWMIGLEAEPVLRDLGTRGDIIKTMHRACTGRGQDRGIADYVIDANTASSPVIGRLVATGLHDELTCEACAVIDGTDGRAHHVRLRGIEAFVDAPTAGGIVEVRRFGGPDDPRRPWRRP